MFSNPTTLIFSLIALLVGLVLHEFMHAYVGYRLGDDTAKANGRISLNPLVHIDPFGTLLLPGLILVNNFLNPGFTLPLLAAAKPVPFNPWALGGGRWGAALVAASGPLTNLVIAVVCGVWLMAMTNFGNVGAIPYQLLGAFVSVNVALFVFNMIPLPPLDGSRVLYAAAPQGLRNVLDSLERGGLGTIFLFLLLLNYTPLGGYLYSLISLLTTALLPQSPLGI